MEKGKVLILFLVFFIILSSFTAIIISLKNNSSNSDSVFTTAFVPISTTSEKDGFKLVINGNDVTDKCDIILNAEEHKLALPVLFISYALGAEIKGDIKENVEIKFLDEVYILNGMEKRLTLKNQKFDIIKNIDSYSESSMYLQNGNDIFIESNLLEHYMYLINCELKIDWMNKLVSIDEKSTRDIKVLVDNQKISSVGVRINNEKKYAELPVVRICEELGAQIKWDDECAFITFGKETYELDIVNFTLYKEGSNVDLLTPPVGGAIWTYYRSDDNELFVDSITLSYFFYKIGVMAIVDAETNTVNINRKD